MSALSEADVIAAELPSVTLAGRRVTNGVSVPFEETVTLEAGMANLRLIEKQFGSISGMYDAINLLNGDDAFGNPIIGTVIDLLACFMPRGWRRDPAELGEVLPQSRLKEYADALGATIEIAFPQPKADAPAEDGPGNAPALDPAKLEAAQAAWTPGTPETSPSHGLPSGTEPPSSWDALTPSSGG